MLETMLEGIEYLMVNNPMGKVLKFIYALRDEAAAGNMKVLIPVDRSRWISRISPSWNGSARCSYPKLRGESMERAGTEI